MKNISFPYFHTPLLPTVTAPQWWPEFQMLFPANGSKTSHALSLSGCVLWVALDPLSQHFVPSAPRQRGAGEVLGNGQG